MYAFQSESTLSSCLNVKKLLAQNRHDISNLSDSNELVRKRALHFLANLTRLTKWFSVFVGTKWLWVQIPLPSLGSESISPALSLPCAFTIAKSKYGPSMY